MQGFQCPDRNNQDVVAAPTFILPDGTCGNDITEFDRLRKELVEAQKSLSVANDRLEEQRNWIQGLQNKKRHLVGTPNPDFPLSPPSSPIASPIEGVYSSGETEAERQYAFLLSELSNRDDQLDECYERMERMMHKHTAEMEQMMSNAAAETEQMRSSHAAEVEQHIAAGSEHRYGRLILLAEREQLIGNVEQCTAQVEQQAELLALERAASREKDEEIEGLKKEILAREASYDAELATKGQELKKAKSEVTELEDQVTFLENLDAESMGFGDEYYRGVFGDSGLHGKGKLPDVPMSARNRMARHKEDVLALVRERDELRKELRDAERESDRNMYAVSRQRVRAEAAEEKLKAAEADAEEHAEQFAAAKEACEQFVDALMVEGRALLAERDALRADVRARAENVASVGTTADFPVPVPVAAAVPPAADAATQTVPAPAAADASMQTVPAPAAVDAATGTDPIAAPTAVDAATGTDPVAAATTAPAPASALETTDVGVQTDPAPAPAPVPAPA